MALLAARVAARMGCPSPAIRAVATAVGRNPISILVPCHRIVGARGAVGGYAGGVARKLELLARRGCFASWRIEVKSREINSSVRYRLDDYPMNFFS